MLGFPISGCHLVHQQMTADTALRMTKRVIIDRRLFFLSILSLNNWPTALRGGFIVPLEDLLYIVHLFTSYAHASVLTLRLTRHRFAQPGDPVTPDDTLVVYMRSLLLSVRKSLYASFYRVAPFSSSMLQQARTFDCPLARHVISLLFPPRASDKMV